MGRDQGPGPDRGPGKSCGGGRKHGAEAEAGASVSAPGVLSQIAHAGAGARAAVDPISVRAAADANAHLGLLGVQLKKEGEVGLLRTAISKSLTVKAGTRDFNYDIYSTELYSWDKGYNRRDRNFGFSITIPGEGTFGAHFGCLTKLCWGNCLNFKFCPDNE